MDFIPIYILVLAFTIVVDYFAGILIEKSIGAKRKWFLRMSIVANIGILGFFKYFNFFNDNIGFVLKLFNFTNPVHNLSFILPIGLSFHTFQAMSYTIEVYRGNQKAERKFGIYALYVMFYPQLVAGPIERPQNIIHQFYEPKKFEYNRVVAGLKIVLWGFFKKLVIADRLSMYVNAVYNNPYHHSGKTLFVATFFFWFQIYCDFSGYSDIAIGTAKVMGFDLMENFKRPMFGGSIQGIWNRWHLSL
ncbi:MAG TPA: MBOAT family O-acyltransferase, partial [Parafilimonas sp.]